MIFDIKDFLSEDSLLVTRYNLTDERVHKIQLFYERCRKYRKVGTDLELLIPCVLVVLKKNGSKIDLLDEVRYLASFYFDELEGIRRQRNIYDNFLMFADDYVERRC